MICLFASFMFCECNKDLFITCLCSVCSLYNTRLDSYSAGCWDTSANANGNEFTWVISGINSFAISMSTRDKFIANQFCRVTFLNDVIRYYLTGPIVIFDVNKNSFSMWILISHCGSLILFFLHFRYKLYIDKQISCINVTDDVTVASCDCQFS